MRILERRRLAVSEDPEALRCKLEGAYRERFCSPWPAARDGHVDEVIEPAQTRARLLEFLGMENSPALTFGDPRLGRRT